MAQYIILCYVMSHVFIQVDFRHVKLLIVYFVEFIESDVIGSPTSSAAILNFKMIWYY